MIIGDTGDIGNSRISVFRNFFVIRAIAIVPIYIEWTVIYVLISYCRPSRIEHYQSLLYVRICGSIVIHEFLGTFNRLLHLNLKFFDHLPISYTSIRVSKPDSLGGRCHYLLQEHLQR